MSKTETVKWCIQVLAEYPTAKGLPGKPDEAIALACLEAVQYNRTVLNECLRAMHHAHKTPTKSWAWFVTLITQYAGGKVA